MGRLEIIRSPAILGSMVSHDRVIVGLSQSAPAVGWGSPLHAWLASVNWISSARCLNRRYRYGARGMHYHILLRQYSLNCYTYNSVVKNTYQVEDKTKFWAGTYYWTGTKFWAAGSKFWSAKSRVRLVGVTENAGRTCRKLSGIKRFFASRE